jgi:TrwC relaxase
LARIKHRGPLHEEQCTTGAFAGANDGGEGAAGVVADIAKLTVGREEYYTRELATDHEEYLSGHGESPGRWYGAGASSLKLEGEASVAGFQAMFEGRDPTTGELLGRPHARNAVPAFDVVLRPTKSVFPTFDRLLSLVLVMVMIGGHD